MWWFIIATWYFWSSTNELKTLGPFPSQEVCEAALHGVEKNHVGDIIAMCYEAPAPVPR